MRTADRQIIDRIKREVRAATTPTGRILAYNQDPAYVGHAVVALHELDEEKEETR